MITIMFKHYEDGRDLGSWMHADYGPPLVGHTLTLGGVEFTVTDVHWVNAQKVIVRVKFGTGREM